MAWEARVRSEYRMGAVTAFGGREYVKGAWRPVPDEQAGSAGAHPFLEVREVGGAVLEGAVVDVVDVVDVVEAPPALPALPAVEEKGATDTDTDGAPVKGATAARRGKA